MIEIVIGYWFPPNRELMYLKFGSLGQFSQGSIWPEKMFEFTTLEVL